ncbi:hypothetical protein BC834DRAFT_327617 [Gloeopeniophorella convolvens]|nr:hypothetical protein BC834DRAFT_327617 [Gloeopeniophorella convolvens]
MSWPSIDSARRMGRWRNEFGRFGPGLVAAAFAKLRTKPRFRHLISFATGRLVLTLPLATAIVHPHRLWCHRPRILARPPITSKATASPCHQRRQDLKIRYTRFGNRSICSRLHCSMPLPVDSSSCPLKFRCLPPCIKALLFLLQYNPSLLLSKPVVRTRPNSPAAARQLVNCTRSNIVPAFPRSHRNNFSRSSHSRSIALLPIYLSSSTFSPWDNIFQLAQNPSPGSSTVYRRQCAPRTSHLAKPILVVHLCLDGSAWGAVEHGF